jgi:uncharacterized protein YgiM (DUF1202 family)
VKERIKVEIARGIISESPDVAKGYVPLKRGDELKVVNVRGNDVLNMRKYATDESPVVDFIPPNVQGGIYYLGESRGQWIFVQYDRAKEGWVNSGFLEPITSVGVRIQ